MGYGDMRPPSPSVNQGGRAQEIQALLRAAESDLVLARELIYEPATDPVVLVESSLAKVQAALVLLARGGVIVWIVTAIACGPGRPDSIAVTAAEYGEHWPFTVPSGVLRCDKDGARLLVRMETPNRLQYGINGSAKSFGWTDATEIMRPGMVGADLQPFIDRGLTLCR